MYAVLCLPFSLGCLTLVFFIGQERHHYTSVEFLHVPLSAIQARDKKKVALARAKGITLITVPCWWDGQYQR